MRVVATTAEQGQTRVTRGRVLMLATILVIALKLAFLFAFAWHSRFVMDEFGQLGYAKYLPDELYDTVWPAKAVGFQLFIELAHLLGWDARSIFLIGRLEVALLSCGSLALVYVIARRIGEPAARALVIVVALLCFSNFIERSFRTIAEPLALFFGAASLLAILNGNADRARTLVAAGVLGGLSFLTTQKAVYFNVALGLALVGDAWLARRWAAGARRGAMLVLGWMIAVLAYCLAFGGTNFLAVAETLIFGPAEVASRGGAEYGGLRHFVIQTLTRNMLLYALCFAGMLLELRRLTILDWRRRIALLFTVVITGLVFAHDQPWPYVFIMALPFIALWVLVPLDRLALNRRYEGLAGVVLATGVVLSFARNLWYTRIDNHDQLQLVERAEALVGPQDVYFDGIGMLPNRREPSTLWLDRHYVLKTIAEGRRSEAHAIFSKSPPKLILWSYRMDAIEPVIGPIVANGYVQVAPNLRIAGRRLRMDEPVSFNVPVGGKYALYSLSGNPVRARVQIDNRLAEPPLDLTRGPIRLILRHGPRDALLLPVGSYGGRIISGTDNKDLFADVYN